MLMYGVLFMQSRASTRKAAEQYLQAVQQAASSLQIDQLIAVIAQPAQFSSNAAAAATTSTSTGAVPAIK